MEQVLVLTVLKVAICSTKQKGNKCLCIQLALRAYKVPLTGGDMEKLSLCLAKLYAMKAYGGLEVYIHVFWTSALVRGEWSASRTGHFTSGKGVSGTHCVRG
jgi:hypothetical protein